MSLSAPPSSGQKISTLALVLLITGAIDSIRNLPSTALFGSELIFFFLMGAVVFLIPVALISAELAAAWIDDEAGIFQWLHLAFGERFAFLGIWLQWVNTMVWYPTILSFIAGTAAYLISPELAQNKYYLIGVIIATFWLVTLINLNGLKTSAQFAGICTVFGMILPMAMIIAFGFSWLFSGKPLQVDFSWQTMVPTFKEVNSWSSMTAIITSFLGMELTAVHVKSIKNPQVTFPKATFFSVAIILFTMCFGSLAIAFVIPAKEIHLVDGVMQTFAHFFHQYHADILLPITIVLLLIGSLGSMVNWIISPAKGLLIASEHHFLPQWLDQVNDNGVPQRILILQAVLVTVLSTALLIMPSINSIYWLFTDLSTELYLMMYLLMFIAAIKIKFKYPDRHRPFRIPGGKIGYLTVCSLGIIGCMVALIVGFLPPEESIQMTGHDYRIMFTAGIFAMLLPALLFFKYHLKQVIAA